MAETTTVTLDGFLSQYMGCKDEVRKQNALRSALEALRQPVVDRGLTLKAVAKHYGIHPTTAWRLQLPSRNYLGRKLYYLGDCDQYLKSAEFETRLSDLRRQRRAAREHHKGAL